MANEIDFEFNGLDSNAIDNRIKEELENCCEGSMKFASAAGTSVDVNAADAFDWEVVESSIKNVAPGTLQDGTPSSCKVTMKNNDTIIQKKRREKSFW